MEALEDSNCQSLTNSFSVYERYMRTFNVVDSFEAQSDLKRETLEGSCEGNIDSVNKHSGRPDGHNIAPLIVENVDKAFNCESRLKDDSNHGSLSESLENYSATADHSLLTEKSDVTDVPVSSEESKSDCCQHPVFITSTMENSNNAVDSVPLFRDKRPSESVFKLPISELSFNGTLKHVQKLKPIVDPITALSSRANELKEKEECSGLSNMSSSNPAGLDIEQKISTEHTDTSTGSSDVNRDKGNESTGDSQYEEFNKKTQFSEEAPSKWNSEQSYSSLEGSFDSGVRSPDIFSEDDELGPGPVEVEEPFWDFLKDLEPYEKKKVRRLEETLKGILPPPSVTTIKTDVTEMLNKYYAFLPAFNGTTEVNADTNSSTPTKGVSFVHIPPEPISAMSDSIDISLKETNELANVNLDKSNDKSLVEMKMCSEAEAKETIWPEVMKCRYYDIYYNLTQHSSTYESLSQRLVARCVGAETACSVIGAPVSPTSATKKKAMRLKQAAAGSPGRRLSHLARRRQAFCSAATVNAHAHAHGPKMVLIDKNFFPHRKLVSSGERRSPRLKRTPGKNTPSRKTPRKKTPKSSSTKKRAMRRLIMDSENITRSQPREALKRALFISPENRKTVPQPPCSSVPLQAMKSKRTLFGSPITAETKSSDGSQSDMFLKRKRYMLDDAPESSRSKIAKSLSFGGDTIASKGHEFVRRASEVFANRNSAELNETHKKKLLWAVSEALRVHGWRMSSPGFREKASSLARLTRKLFSLPPHAARLAQPRLSTSETMLKLARQYVFAIIQGRTVEECFHDEQMKLANDTSNKVTGYISATAYQQMTSRQTRPIPSTLTSRVKENCSDTKKQEPQKSASKNILQDKLINIDSNSNSSGFNMMEKPAFVKSNSMPSFEEAAKMRARRQISFDNVDFPKR